MNPRVIFVFLFLLLSSKSFCKVSKFLDTIKEPLHHTPNLYPETYDQQGYTKLLDTLIRWEMTRSMYDYRFGSALGQIKSLSRITHSEYGMAMFHYFEGIRRGLGDPLNAENDFLKALNYFEVHRDTSAIIHTAMHMFRLSLNTTMLEIGNLSRYYYLYNSVLSMGGEVKDPLDKIIHLRNIILYDEYFCGIKKIDYYSNEIIEGLSVIESLDTTYDYYRFLMFNTFGILHSKNIKYEESESWHEKAYDVIKKYPSPELNMAEYRIAAMKYENGKYQESVDYLRMKIDNKRTDIYPNFYIHNWESHAFMFRLLALNYHKLGDIEMEDKCSDAANFHFVNIFTKRRHNLYMKDMAAIYKNEKDTKIILKNQRNQISLILIIFIVVVITIVVFIFYKFKADANKKLQNEVRKRDFIYSMIGHDLSSPILAMDNTLNHIEMTLHNQLTPTQKDYISHLKSEINGAHYLLLNLLHWYKSDNDLFGNKPDRTLCHIKKNIDQSVQHLFLHSNEKSIIFINNCPEHITFKINADMFNTVIRNIVDNAIKHSDCTTLTVNGSIENEKLMVTIHDNGTGMDPKFVQLFNQSNSIYDLNNSEIKIGLGTIFILEFAKYMISNIKITSDKEGSTYYWEINA